MSNTPLQVEICIGCQKRPVQGIYKKLPLCQGCAMICCIENSKHALRLMDKHFPLSEQIKRSLEG